jgi:hypothetical protein
MNDSGYFFIDSSKVILQSLIKIEIRLDLSKYFNDLLVEDQELSPAVAAIKTLLEYIKQNSFGTVAELREKVIKAIDSLTRTDSSAISIKSGCEMLLRFITLTALDAGVSLKIKLLNAKFKYANLY